MLDKKVIVLAITVMTLALCALRFSEEEENRLLGLPMASEEELRNQWGDKTFFESVENADELFLFEGEKIPYDKTTNTFYITQNVENEDYDGTLTTTVKGVKATFLSDGYESVKNTGISEGYSYRIWICDGEEASICNVIFTGLPVVSVDADDWLEADGDVGSTEDSLSGYMVGRINVWSPTDEDYDRISNRSSRMLYKVSASGETITCKLRNKNGDNKKISFLSMGKQDTWKLYKVPDADETGIRMMLASQLWNAFTEKEKFAVPCTFVELVQNGEYKGLYLLCPRKDNDFFNLSKNYYVVKTEDISEEEGDYYNDLPRNASDIVLWAQATCAYANLYDDLTIVTNGKGKNYLLPGKPEHVFGQFPNRLEYFTYKKEQRVIMPDDFFWEDDSAEDFYGIMQVRWEQARYSLLSDETIQFSIDYYSDQLKNSGLAARRGITEESRIELLNSTLLRYRYVDRYYGLEISNATVAE